MQVSALQLSWFGQGSLSPSTCLSPSRHFELGISKCHGTAIFLSLSK
ncbi:unnamed protein product, partial [Didymodactylos carnosus]